MTEKDKDTMKWLNAEKEFRANYRHELEKEGYITPEMTEYEKEFAEAISMGREVEFSCEGVDYFASHNGRKDRNEKRWYVYNEATKETEYFSSPSDLLQNAKLGNKFLRDSWDIIEIAYIL